MTIWALRLLGAIIVVGLVNVLELDIERGLPHIVPGCLKYSDNGICEEFVV